jgi:hypothetical protein
LAAKLSDSSVSAAFFPFRKTALDNVQIPSDETLVSFIAEYIRKAAKSSTKERAHTYVETAGGERLFQSLMTSPTFPRGS